MYWDRTCRGLCPFYDKSNLNSNIMKRLYALFLIPFFLMCLSCQNEIELVSSGSTELNVKESRQKTKIAKQVDVLSEEDAMSVAAIFSDNTQLTKSYPGQIRDVVTIKGETGKPLMYAVNYDDGYILVSATRRYFPVLAQVESGRFNAEETGTGADLFLSKYKAEINYALEKDTSFVTTEWIPYVDYSSDNAVRTKMDDSYWEILDEYWLEWANERCNIYFLREKPEAMPEGLYNSFCRIASDFMGEDSDYMEYAVIVEKYIDHNYSKGPFCQTKWNQYSPFNAKLRADEPLGCTTIAAGQIMKYFRSPASYNWDAMPDNTSNDVLSTFLKELHDKIGVKDGGATINQVKRALKDYGYNVSIISHSITDVTTSLYNDKPVYMRGECSNTGGGHAWVCDGYRYSEPEYVYRLFTVPPGEIPVTRLEEAYRESFYDASSIVTHHMNWGWGGDHNGYYYDTRIVISRTDGVTDFNLNRKDILIK